MKTFVLSLCFLLLCGFSADIFGAEKKAKKEKPKKGTLYHVVSFKFKASASEGQIKEVEEAFQALQKSIPKIKKLEWGTNVSPEKHDKGFTHLFLLTFKTEQDRDDYLVHPEHKAFGQKLGPILEDVFVVDFWAEK